MGARTGDDCRAAAMAMVVLSMVMATVEANYTLEILMLSYENPTHMATSLETFRHGCCERDAATPCDLCDNAFRVCVRERATREVEGGCDLLKMESTVIEEDNDDLMFTIGQDVGGLSNPILVSGEMWPGTVEVVFNVFDLDMTATIGSTSDVVDNIFIYPNIQAVPSTNSKFSDPETFTGNASLSHLGLAFRLTCGPDHYGPYCTICRPGNDSTYTCDNVTGKKVCLEGYQGPNCTECTPAKNCSAEGGYCVEPGDCLCRGGYSGANCSDHVCLNQTCSNGPCRSINDPPYFECPPESSECDPDCKSGEQCVNGSCVCVEGCEKLCEVECGEKGECVKVEGEDDRCDCEEGYSYTGELCGANPTIQDSGGSDLQVVVVVVATVGGLLFVLIVLVVIAICVLLFRGCKSKKTDDGVTPNPYETPFFRKWRGNGHASNGLSERKFENPLYSERTNSPASPPLPPRPPEHPYATLEDINNPYAHIPGDPGGSLDVKPPQLELPEPDPLAVANPYDHIGPQSLEVGGALPEASPRAENPYLDPVNSAPRPDSLPKSGSDNAMNSATTLYAHIQ